jgi:polysaccharide deacetylase family protein (PEP-CTERM system associated)
MRNALTVDLEDWYHPQLVRRRLSPEERELQIERSTRALLDLFGEQGVKATFFVLGEIVQRCPRLIEDIVAQGHELASHGMRHTPLWDMTADEFRFELQEFADTIGTVVRGVEVVGFRAPTFSLDNRTVWALGILSEFGYRYDSSVFPLKTPVYGVDNSPLVPYRPSLEDVTLEDSGGALVEFPLSVWTWLGLKVPVCGGFYLRALPFRFVQFCLRQIGQRQPFNIYVHPWEVYQGTPRLTLPLVSRFITYHNIDTTMRRLAGLLEEFCFAPMGVVLEEMGQLAK